MAANTVGVILSMKTKILGLSIVVLFAAAGTTVQAAELIDPPQSEWGCELSDAKVQQGITAGLIGRGWTVTSNDKAGNMVAQVIVRGKHTLVVDVVYTNTSVDINYKSSDNLKYKNKNGVEHIHRNANSWMDNVKNDITAQLNALCNMG